MNLLRTVAWVVAIVYATVPAYWLIVHTRVRQWAQRGGRRLMTVGPVWLALWVIAGVISVRWRNVALYEARWTWALGGALISLGFIFYSLGSQGFSIDRALGRPELEPGKHEQRLVASGIRARIRHPYYLGHLVEMTGWAVGSGLAVAYALLALGIVSGYFMIRAEERELEARFGAEYAAYRAHSAAMFPGVW